MGGKIHSSDTINFQLFTKFENILFHRKTYNNTAHNNLATHMTANNNP